MVWFKVDDKLHSNTKIRNVLADEPAALALWTVAGSWSSDELTDGFIPDSQLPWLIPAGAEQLARKLVKARLWSRVSGGYQFRQWAEDGDGTRRNPTREEVETQRRTKAEAGRKGGLASGKTRSKPEARASANASAGARRLVEPPTRPDPKDKRLLSPDGDERFEEFWKTYPPRKNNSKHKARLAYDAALKRGVDPGEIQTAVAAYAKDRQGEDQQYTKLAVTWLHARPWEEPEPLVPEPRRKFAWEN